MLSPKIVCFFFFLNIASFSLDCTLPLCPVCKIYQNHILNLNTYVKTFLHSVWTPRAGLSFRLRLVPTSWSVHQAILPLNAATSKQHTELMLEVKRSGELLLSGSARPFFPWQLLPLPLQLTRESSSKGFNLWFRFFFPFSVHEDFTSPARWAGCSTDLGRGKQRAGAALEHGGVEHWRHQVETGNCALTSGWHPGAGLLTARPSRITPRNTA